MNKSRKWLTEILSVEEAFTQVELASRTASRAKVCSRMSSAVTMTAEPARCAQHVAFISMLDEAACRDLDDHALGAALAESAGKVLLGVRASHAAEDASTLRDHGDRASQEFLARWLAVARPADAVLSEEAADDRSRLSARRVWIIDPLDGTREFAEADRDDWAVHVALWVNGELAAGAVALPAQGLTLRTGAGGVTPVERQLTGPPRMVVSRTRPPRLALFVAERLRAELIPMGSAGAKVTAVARGLADLYVHGGGQYEWDSAAPVAVGRQAGLHTSRLDGSELRYNQPDPQLPDLLVCRPDLAEAALDAIAAAP